MKKVKIIIDMNKQEIIIYYGRNRIGHICFTEEPSNINVWDMHIELGYKQLGFGRLLMNCMLGIASGLKKPIYLITYPSSIGFYSKFGFICQRLCKGGEYKGIKVSFENLNPLIPFEDQVSDRDLIWFPLGVKEAIIPIL